MSSPRRSWRKNTGPARVELDADRCVDEERRQDHEPNAGEDHVDHPLHDERRARQACRRHADEWQALEQVHACTRSDDVEQARDDVHDHVAVAQRPNDAHGLAVRLVGERDDDAVDAVLVHERPQLVELTERCDATRFRPALERLGVDEPDEV